MAKPIHIMIRVLDEARAIDFYRRALGLGVADRFAFDDFTLVYLRGRNPISSLSSPSIMAARRSTRLATATAIWRSWSTISMPSTQGSARKACTQADQGILP